MSTPQTSWSGAAYTTPQTSWSGAAYTTPQTSWSGAAYTTPQTSWSGAAYTWRASDNRRSGRRRRSMILADEGCRGCGADLAVAGSWAELRQGGGLSGHPRGLGLRVLAG